MTFSVVALSLAAGLSGRSGVAVAPAGPPIERAAASVQSALRDVSTEAAELGAATDTGRLDSAPLGAAPGSTTTVAAPPPSIGGSTVPDPTLPEPTVPVPTGTAATVATSALAAEPTSAAALEPVTASHLDLDEVRALTLARISYPWQTRLPDWTIEFLSARDGYLGATWSNEHRIEIYVRPSQRIDELAFTLAHELGHAVDLTRLDTQHRDRWLAARDAVGVDWWTHSGASDYAVGAGDFAECFAVWQVGGVGLSLVAGQPSNSQLELLAALVDT